MNQQEYLNHFEQKLHEILFSHLQQRKYIDVRMPELVDIEGKWTNIVQSYLPDGIREFNSYPEVSLGWMMYIGMAIAKYWDTNWEQYSKQNDIYQQLLNIQGFDYLDEVIRRDVLQLTAQKFENAERVVNSCAQITYNYLRHEQIEAGSILAYNAYVTSLHQMYIMGAAVELYQLGYKMTKVN